MAFFQSLVDLRLCNPGMVRVECIETRGRHSEWLCEAVLYEAVQIHSRYDFNYSAEDIDRCAIFPYLARLVCKGEGWTSLWS